MNPSLAALVFLLPAQTQSPTPGELAQHALAVFESKCVECHGTTLPHPRSGFGVVNDLSRLAASPKYVTPSRPQDSEIWKQISAGDMPPDEAKAGPLTDEERNAIYAWIAAGAPALTGGTPPAPTPPPPLTGDDARSPAPTASAAENARPPLSVARLITLIGHAHVVVIHFPIAMLTAAAMTEVWAALRIRRSPPVSIVFLWIGAVAALAAAGLGWVRALDGFAGPLSNPTSLANLHRWIGTAAALAAPAVAFAAYRDSSRGGRSLRVRAAIIALGFGIGLAGHFGGLLTHGAGFFDP